MSSLPILKASIMTSMVLAVSRLLLTLVRQLLPRPCLPRLLPLRAGNATHPIPTCAFHRSGFQAIWIVETCPMATSGSSVAIRTGSTARMMALIHTSLTDSAVSGTRRVLDHGLIVLLRTVFPAG